MYDKNHSPKILVVDDDRRMLESLKDLLTFKGYDLLTASEGKEAIRLLEERNFSVVLLDLGLPDIGGHKIMDYIRESGIQTVVIVLSGAASIDAAIESLRRGAYDYLRKPYQPQKLLKIIDNAFNKIKLEKENFDLNKKIRESERLYRYLVNNSPDIIYMLDAQGVFTYVNDSAELLLGFNPDELLGEHYSKIIHPEDLDFIKFVFDERRTGDRASRNVELRLKSKWFDQSSDNEEEGVLPIELHSMGLYDFDRPIKTEYYRGTYGVARDITDRKRAEKAVYFQAYHDLLTNLPNRALFKDRLGMAIAHAERNDQKIAVMFIDLDRFKLVNDTLGHLIGDELLREVSRRLLQVVRREDTLSRWGGDEFLLLCPSLSEREGAERVVEKIIASLRKPFNIRNHEIYLGASIGVSIYPLNGDSVDSLIVNSDVAMYYAKQRCKGGYQFYNENMNSAFSQRLLLEAGIHKGLQEGQFGVVYQPQVDIETGIVIGMESLVRWKHPELGFISPGHFIPLAEETGLIRPIGKFVMDAVVSELVYLRNNGFPDVRIGVNLSAVEIEQKNFVEEFLDLLERNNISFNDIEVEITESAIMHDIDDVGEKIRKLHDRGIRIAVDDFGTGYSSLNYLDKLTIDTIKIDRAFVKDIGDHKRRSTIIMAIVAMARGLGVDVIAEGVETEMQRDYLRDLGCSVMQGFLFSKPMMPEDANIFLGVRDFKKN